MPIRIIKCKNICPPGEAYGSHDLRRRGRSDILDDITVWPKTKSYAIADGTVPHEIVQVRGTWMWKQEMYVYMQERRHSLGEAVATLEDKSCPACPRPKGMWATVEPMAQDFGAMADWWLRWQAEAKKLSSKPAPELTDD